MSTMYNRYVSADLWYFDEPEIDGRNPLGERMTQRDVDGKTREYRRLSPAWAETIRRDMCEFRRQYEIGNLPQDAWDSLRTRFNQAVHFHLYPSSYK